MTLGAFSRAATAAISTSLLAFSGGLPAGAQAAPALPPVQRALVHHAVSTANPEAQAAFDEGLTLIYAFNRDEAAKRFAKAAQLDPSLGMAWWGVALANGPNLNFDMTPERIATANDALAKARALSDKESPAERRYVEALATRYPRDAKVERRGGYRAYRDAMAKLHADFPDDLDAATLYAESSMDVDEWGWSNGVPTPAAQTIAATLVSVLARSPNHPGANHYYVHVMDFAGVADRALPSARRLSALPIEPAASHLVHMSGHNYLDLGLFVPLERDNKSAVDDDLAYAPTIGKTPWQLDYFGHNLDFYVGGALMLDDQPEIARAVTLFREAKRPQALLAMARNGQWDAVLANAPLPTTNVTMRYVRGLAFLGKNDVTSARAELAALDTIRDGASGFLKFISTNYDDVLTARVAHADGNDALAVTKLRGIIASTAAYPPEAFPPWYYPVGEWLGAVLLARGDLPGAEAAYRADLQRTPHNARALYGLMQTLSRQGRVDESRAIAPEIAANWRGPSDDLRSSI
ncbi:MAG: tetratricopeptide repeat protein [Candidatus Eremiobacteraeota bacterium]|nr:tetratricopeptide repeat protein [Candidatus Eremiobacteraeota bacterium]